MPLLAIVLVLCRGSDRATRHGARTVPRCQAAAALPPARWPRLRPSSMTMDRKTLIAVVVLLVIFFAYPFILRYFGLDRYVRPAPTTSQRTTPQSAAIRDSVPGAGQRPQP